MPQATLIYNPLAGPASLDNPIQLVAERWQSLGWQVDIQPTEAAGHATELAVAAAQNGHKLVIAAGGDGTLGEVANGLAFTNTAIAPLPIGTGNSFAKELHMPRPNLLNHQKLYLASAALEQGRIHAMDLGFTRGNGGKNGRYWLLWTGIGADGFLVEKLEPRPKWSKRLGALGYAVQSLALMPRLPSMYASVRVDGTEIAGEYFLVLISNSRRYAGGELTLSPYAQLDDGRFEVWFFKGRHIYQIVQYLLQVRAGKHSQNKNINMVTGAQIAIQTDAPALCQTDGDRAGQTPITCEIKPGALRVLVPNTAPDGLFCHPGWPL